MPPLIIEKYSIRFLMYKKGQDYVSQLLKINDLNHYPETQKRI